MPGVARYPCSNLIFLAGGTDALSARQVLTVTARVIAMVPPEQNDSRHVFATYDFVKFSQDLRL